MSKDPREYFWLATNGDVEAVHWIADGFKKPLSEAMQVVEGMREGARLMGVADSVSIHAKVFCRPTFRSTIPNIGPCAEHFDYLQDWDFPDPPIKKAVVSWIPVPLAASCNLGVVDQQMVLKALHTKLNLPTWYDLSFGSALIIAGMAFAHEQATGNNPFNNMLIRTATLEQDGSYRLSLSWHKGSPLDCGRYPIAWGTTCSPRIAVFAVGVVEVV